MGDGEFIGNGSIHWKIDHGAQQDMDIQINDANPVNRDHGVNVKRRVRGKDPRRELANETLEVELRFETVDQARDALELAKGTANNKAGYVYVTVVVSAPRRANPNHPPDVRVHW